jgi:hypothetical protein
VLNANLEARWHQLAPLTWSSPSPGMQVLVFNMYMKRDVHLPVQCPLAASVLLDL